MLSTNIYWALISIYYARSCLIYKVVLSTSIGSNERNEIYTEPQNKEGYNNSPICGDHRKVETGGIIVSRQAQSAQSFLPWNLSITLIGKVNQVDQMSGHLEAQRKYWMYCMVIIINNTVLYSWNLLYEVTDILISWIVVIISQWSIRKH